MAGGTPIDYKTLCQYVGQLFLETRHAVESVAQQQQQREAALEAEIASARKERDEALAALVRHRAQTQQGA